MKKFEYHKIQFKSNEERDKFFIGYELIELGQRGWELCAWRPFIDRDVLIFKRELERISEPKIVDY